MPKWANKIVKQTNQNLSHLNKHLAKRADEMGNEKLGDKFRQNAAHTEATKQKYEEKIKYGKVVSTQDERLKAAKDKFKSLDTADIETALTQYEAEDLTHTEQPAKEKYVEKPQAEAKDKRTVEALKNIREGQILEAIDTAQELRNEIQQKQTERNTLTEEQWEAKTNLTGEIRALVSDVKLIKKEIVSKFFSIIETKIKEIPNDESQRGNAIKEINHLEAMDKEDFQGKLFDENDKTELLRLKTALTNIGTEDEDV